MGPVGHTLSGITFYFSYCAFRKKTPAVRLITASAILPNFPDLDLLSVIFVGLPKANLYHHSYTHTFFFALIIGLLSMLLSRGPGKGNSLGAAAFGFAMISLHLVGDYFTRDTGFPFGEMLAWPVSSIYVTGPALFLDVSKASINSLFSIGNLKTSIHEFIIFTPVLSWLSLFYISGGSERLSAEISS
jgi:hypothetical protein